MEHRGVETDGNDPVLAGVHIHTARGSCGSGGSHGTVDGSAGAGGDEVSILRNGKEAEVAEGARLAGDRDHVGETDADEQDAQ